MRNPRAEPRMAFAISAASGSSTTSRSRTIRIQSFVAASTARLNSARCFDTRSCGGMSSTSCSRREKYGVNGLRSSAWMWPRVITDNWRAGDATASASRSQALVGDIFANPHDARRAAGGLVDLDHRAGEADVALRDLELARRVHEKPVQRLVGTEPDHRVVCAGHPDVGLIRGAVGKDPLVG